MWFFSLPTLQRRALFAAMLGWMFDAMDFLIYVLAIGRLKAYFGFGDATAGLLGTFTLISAAVGGLAFGVIADRIGRVRTLNITIIIFSLCSLGAATSQSVVQLAIWRAVLGLGMGGEWASGGVLVAETLPAELRNKATSLMQSMWAIGAILAAGLSGLFLDVLPLGDEQLIGVGGQRQISDHSDLVELLCGHWDPRFRVVVPIGSAIDGAGFGGCDHPATA